MGGHIEIKGADGRVHVIDADRADEFFDGRTGLPTTDDEYDESKARLQADNDHLIPEEFR
jgi:hypothetical protein